MSKAVEEVPKTNTYQCNVQNHIRGWHVQYNGTLAPLQYLITSYDTGNKTTYILKGGSKPQYTMMSFQNMEAM